MEKEKNAGSLMLDRGVLTLTGVTKVFESGEHRISLSQGDTVVTVSGAGMTVTEVNLETGRFQATGNVREIKLSSAREKGDVLKKLFK